MGLLGKETEQNIAKIVVLLEWFKALAESHEIKITGTVKLEPKEK